MKLLHKIDMVMDGILLTGAVNSSLTGLTKTSVTGRLMGRNKQAMTAYYSLIGAATAYKFFRAVGPKTKEEQRLLKAAKLYEQAETYQKRANIYRRAAEVFFRRRLKSFKTATSS